MQPIPFPAQEGMSVETLMLIGFILGLAFFALGVAVAIFGSRPVKRKESPLSLVGLILAAAGVMPAVVAAPAILNPSYNYPISAGQVKAQTKIVQSEISKSYGLKLTEAQASALHYPSKAPKSDFKIFGHFKEQNQTDGKAFESRTVYLVWSDGSLGLSQSSDGESFAPLKEAH